MRIFLSSHRRNRCMRPVICPAKRRRATAFTGLFATTMRRSEACGESRRERERFARRDALMYAAAFSNTMQMKPASNRAPT